jgi:hypothetical protein
MKLLIVVPTKNRPAAFQRQTYRWLQYMDFDYKVFMEKEDVPRYNYLKPEEVVVLPESNKGLGYSLHFARGYALKNGYDAVFKCDDDIVNWNTTERITPKDKELGIKRIVTQYINDSLEVMEKRPQVGGVGLPYGNEMFEVKKFTSINSRFQTAYIVRTEFFGTNPAVNTFEDFYASVKVWYAGYLTLRYGLTGMRCPMPGENAGGHQDFDRFELAKREVEEFRKIEPACQFKSKKDKLWRIEPDLKTFRYKQQKI